MTQDLGCLIAFLFHVPTVGSECSFLMLFDCGRILAIMTLFIPLISRSLEETTFTVLCVSSHLIASNLTKYFNFLLK